ncbi:unnamed protein product [Echinostoma caproni]|uniref:EF-hand domain-containing protein n=1 Tax=Echinostoma caproni TaxID=27848 RepID=A0A183ADP9_9TREM|nr:unnamed protein product [Echinostoma caproni]
MSNEFEEAIAFFMEHLDTDKNGKLSKAEILTIHESDAFKKNIDDLFKKYDRDQDGELNREELIMWLETEFPEGEPRYGLE